MATCRVVALSPFRQHRVLLPLLLPINSVLLTALLLRLSLRLNPLTLATPRNHLHRRTVHILNFNDKALYLPLLLPSTRIMDSLLLQYPSLIRPPHTIRDLLHLSNQATVLILLHLLLHPNPLLNPLITVSSSSNNSLLLLAISNLSLLPDLITSVVLC